MARTLVLVESPTKAREIEKYLGAGYRVASSRGHFRDLPKAYGIDLDTFDEEWEVKNPKVLSFLKKEVRQADTVLLATDGDREGEAIAWHLAEALGLNARTVGRIVFDEITPEVVRERVRNVGAIDLDRVDAQRSRRILDRIVGYDVTKEICWPAQASSAGRVQTPALHILCERERAILRFTPTTFWTVHAEYAEEFSAWVMEEEQPGGSSEGAEDEEPPKRVRKRFSSAEDAEAVVAEARRNPHVISDVSRETVSRRPPPPYRTSTLQQDASRKLHLPAKQTAALAQSLFEAGWITYHRTDSTRVSDKAVEMARAYLAEHHPDLLPQTPPRQRVAADAQDAHEGIRPTALERNDQPPAGSEALYAMIRARFLAYQSKPARLDQTKALIEAGSTRFETDGSVLVEKGYLHFWAEYAKQEDRALPDLASGQALSMRECAARENQTRPPGRMDVADLTRKLESARIGRPSTYPSIPDTLLKREYVREEKAGKRLVLRPTDFGMRVDGLLSETFPNLVSESYTAEMEAALDQISTSTDPLRRVEYLRAWHTDFREQMEAVLPEAAAYIKAHNLNTGAGHKPGAAEDTDTTCDRCAEATYRKVQRKSRGSFLSCPACKFTRDVRAKTRPGECPSCSATLIQRTSKKTGKKFWGCVMYGHDQSPCDHIEHLEGGKSRFEREETNKTCPKCTASKVVILRPRDDQAEQQPFYACADRGCTFTLTVGWLKREEDCPECGGVVLERRKKQTAAGRRAGTRSDRFWGCVNFPKCKFTAQIKTPPGGSE